MGKAACVSLTLLLLSMCCTCFRLPSLPRLRSSFQGASPLRHFTHLATSPVDQAQVQSTDRVLIAGETHIRPSDYIAHPTYGIGKYIRPQGILIGRSDTGEPKYAPGMVVRFQDGEVLWFQRNAVELYLFKLAQAGEQVLSSLVNFAKWNSRVKKAQRDSEEIARNLIETQRVRAKAYREPYLADGPEFKQFEAEFVYPPTVDQQACFDDIAYDMVNSTKPMDRLVIGDVGFGKTEIAMRTAYRAVLSGRQVAVLAPTRVLVGQHLQNFRSRMPGVNIQVLRGLSAGDREARNQATAQIANGTCQIVIGTHAILQPTVEFRNLSLLIIDEEHKFGVLHKEAIKQRLNLLDVLTLSATPIPRTLQISLQGMRKTSMMRSPPLNRKYVKVETIVDVFRYPRDLEEAPSKKKKNMSEKALAKLHIKQLKEKILKDKQTKNPTPQSLADEAKIAQTNEHISRVIKSELARGGQVFAVVPFIADIPRVIERLRECVENLKIILAHGKIKDLDENLAAFKRKEADVLLATTVIENGIDMPNVNTILVFRAELFGMSALYQLKGRVGRSAQQAHAHFYYSPDVDVHGAVNTTNIRLRSLTEHTQLGAGMDVAKDDLRNRGCGNLEGEAQAGKEHVGHDFQAALIETALKRQMDEMEKKKEGDNL